MIMKILFRTKDESNKDQQDEFLALSGGERVMRFIEISTSMLSLSKEPSTISAKDNFILTRKK